MNKPTLEQQKADLRQCIDKLEREFSELEARLAALEAPQAPQQPEAIEWPESPLVCHYGVGFQGDGWYCGECGGGRF